MPDFKTTDALVLSRRPLSEHSVLLNLLTKEHGRYAGVLRGGRKKIPEPGTLVQARWQARLSEQVGLFFIEESHPRACLFMSDKKRLACLGCLCALLQQGLPERQAYPELYNAALNFLDVIETESFLKNYALFEWRLLSSLGFAIDVTRCAGGGNPDNLAFVSPKSACAVSLEKGLPFADKLFKLPRFLWQTETSASVEDIKNALSLTGFFLQKHVLNGKPLPAIRSQIVD